MNKNWLAWYDFSLFGKSFSERVSRQAVWLNNVMAESEVQVNLISDNFSLNFWVHFHCLDTFYTYDFIASSTDQTVVHRLYIIIFLSKIFGCIYNQFTRYWTVLRFWRPVPYTTERQLCRLMFLVNVSKTSSQRKTYFSGINASYFSFSQVKLN